MNLAGYMRFLLLQAAAAFRLRLAEPSVKVRTSGRTGIIYSEGRRTLSIPSEMLASADLSVAIDLSALSGWEPPFQHERLTPDDLSRIQQNLSQAFVGYRIEWQLPAGTEPTDPIRGD